MPSPEMSFRLGASLTIENIENCNGRLSAMVSIGSTKGMKNVQIEIIAKVGLGGDRLYQAITPTYNHYEKIKSPKRIKGTRTKLWII